MTKTLDQPVKQRRRQLLVWSAVLLSTAVAWIVLYALAEVPTIQFDSRPVTATQSGAASDTFAFSFFGQPRPMSELIFIDGDGHPRSLADFKGRPVLLNIWATWCAPCRKEMPSLDRLQADYDPSQLVVLPLSLDRQGLPVVKKFMTSSASDRSVSFSINPALLRPRSMRPDCRRRSSLIATGAKLAAKPGLRNGTAPRPPHSCASILA